LGKKGEELGQKRGVGSKEQIGLSIVWGPRGDGKAGHLENPGTVYRWGKEKRLICTPVRGGNTGKRVGKKKR